MLDRALQTLLEPVVTAMGYQLWGIERHKQPRQLLVRVFIDHEAGITIDDCGKISHQISGVLEVEDPIAGEYTLEVSSPGVQRPLFFLPQFEQHLGDKVFIRLQRNQDGRRKFRGTLAQIEHDIIHLIDENNDVFELPYNDIDKAHLLHH